MPDLEEDIAYEQSEDYATLMGSAVPYWLSSSTSPPTTPPITVSEVLEHGQQSTSPNVRHEYPTSRLFLDNPPPKRKISGVLQLPTQFSTEGNHNRESHRPEIASYSYHQPAHLGHSPTAGGTLVDDIKLWWTNADF